MKLTERHGGALDVSQVRDPAQVRARIRSMCYARIR